MSFSERLRPGRGPGSRRQAAVFTRRRRKLLSGVALAAFALAPIVGPAMLQARTARHSVGSLAPELWPKLAPFRTLVVTNFARATPDQRLAATTLEGAYNQLQGRNRLYVVWNPDDQTWLNAGVLRGVRQSELPGRGSGAAGQLNALLADYGHDIKGAILTNPADPDTVNLATTMAGIDDAMVASPSQIRLLQRYDIPVIYSFVGQSFSSPTAAYQWEFANLLPKTNRADLVVLDPRCAGSLRDYIIATKSFVFYLTSTNAAEKALMNQIISSRPANTPILGYVSDERPDVADLSSLGHFLNVSDFLQNESDFAAVPSLPRLVQPKPRPVRAEPNTVYVGFLVSDGDNAQYVEHHMFNSWPGDADLDAVPEGWTIAPGMADFAPSLIDWYYRHLPRDYELLSGPSGVGYATQMTGAALQQFARLSGAFGRKDSISTVDLWETPSQIAPYARSSGLPSISVDAPLAYLQEGRTVVVGQTNSYTDPASALLSTIEQDSLAETTSNPVFLEPLVDGWNLDRQEVLAIAQALAGWGKTVGKKFVFTTPSELALTEEAYHQGSRSPLPRLNSQAVSGASLLRLPRAGRLQGYRVPTTSGPNLIANPSGQKGIAGWTDTAGTLDTQTYRGRPDIGWNVPATEPHQVRAHTYPAVTDGHTYRFSVQLAGSGQVFMDVYNGVHEIHSPAINLRPSYQTLTWVAAIPRDAPTGQAKNAPQLQVQEIGIGPVAVHIKDTTVQLASTPGGYA
jgi:GxGYxY sequence motif in domain of unknown function N-terminal/GxGYxYP putative glycoside hydrolase C-terminal domain